jgi:putative membrane protein
MKGIALLGGFAVLVGAWALGSARAGITGHMTAHMAAVAIAAPLVAWGAAGSRFDPAERWPGIVAPLQMSLLELIVVWGWHVPAARRFAESGAAGVVLEQTTFFAAGLLLWAACLGTRDAQDSARRAAAIGALLLTTMHMTLLGVLVALAPRPLFGTEAAHPFGMEALHDQQVGGVVMLFVGAGSYLLGGLILLAGMLRSSPERRAAP